MARVLQEVSAIHEYVVKKDNYKLAQEFTKYCVHRCLECRVGVREAERHDQELIMAVVSTKSHFVYVIYMHTNLVVKVQFRKISLQPVTRQIIHPRWE